MTRQNDQNDSHVSPGPTSSTSLAGILVYIWREFLWQLATWAILRLERLQARLKPSPVRLLNTHEPSDHLSTELSPSERRAEMVDQAQAAGYLEWWQAWNLRTKVLSLDAS